MLIYMDPFLQRKAFATFHYALNEKGYLLLGKSETPGSSSSLFASLGKKEKLYTRKSLPGKFMKVTSERGEENLKDKDYSIRSNDKKRDDFQKNADDILLSRYTPAGVIVNEQYEIVQFKGSTRDYLEPATGKASLSVLKMAFEGLSFELRNALHRSKSTREVFIKEGIPLASGKRFITIEVIPLLDIIDLYFLILFRETAAPVSLITNGQEVDNNNRKDEKDIRIEQLSKDLLLAREDMRSIAEDQEAVNEELQSVNEELLSGTEELQSLNEELETSKEELQSTNEELITVNQELFDRNGQFNQARLYSESIVSTISEPLIVLSPDFRVKSANRSFYKTFSITEEDTIDKILFELQSNQWDIPGLRNKLSRIFMEHEQFLEWETAYKFPIIGERTICYTAQPVQKDNGENWILLALNDMTDRKKVEKLLNQNVEEVKLILESLPQIAFTAAAKGSMTYFNNSFLDYTGLSLKEALGNGWQAILSSTQKDEVIKRWGDSISTGEPFEMEIQFKRKKDETYRWHLCRGLALKDDQGGINSWAGGATDINEQKTKEQAKDEFISIASHELKTPLTSAKAYLQMLELNMKEDTNAENLLLIRKANTSVNKVNALIKELLDVSKIKNGRLDFNITPFNFDEMVYFAKEEVEFSSPGHNIIITGAIEQPVNGDMARLQQVIINLLTNAVKYSPEADQVLLNMIMEDSQVKVSVTDSGIGIKKENFDKVFKRYYREDDRAVHFQGLGIGLSICHEIIVRHGGRIWVESKPGKGSTFYFTIPI